jgi:hypothetical protein
MESPGNLMKKHRINDIMKNIIISILFCDPCAE